MLVIRTIREMQSWARTARAAGRRVGLVPTMGGLHEGHLSLVRCAQTHADGVVVSLFVNPIQFGPGEVFAAYPRDEAGDVALCRDEHVDVVFCPDAGEMYAPDHSVSVDETALSANLCGRFRPGHFRGVVTVVLKLFHAALPDMAVFGRKDAQQVRVIERMVRDLNIPVEIVIAPIVREPDGLAMSSRNRYLSPSERRRSLCLHRALTQVEQRVAQGERDAGALRERMIAVIRDGDPPVDIDYVEVVDWNTLRPVDHIRGETLVAVAVRIGRTRLIDNTVVSGAGC